MHFKAIFYLFYSSPSFPIDSKNKFLKYVCFKKMVLREFPGCLWLGLCVLTAEGLDSIPGKGTRSHKLHQCFPKGKRNKPNHKKVALSL